MVADTLGRSPVDTLGRTPVDTLGAQAADTATRQIVAPNALGVDEYEELRRMANEAYQILKGKADREVAMEASSDGFFRKKTKIRKRPKEDMEAWESRLAEAYREWIRDPANLLDESEVGTGTKTEADEFEEWSLD
jgi:hypothetical protein